MVTPTPISNAAPAVNPPSTSTYNLNTPNPFSFLSSSPHSSSHPFPPTKQPPPSYTHALTLLPRAHLTASQSRDSSYTYIHMHSPRHAELFEEFCKDTLPNDDVYVPPVHQPVNPEDEDDVVPDQHAAFGITRALGMGKGKKGTAWKDLGLGDLMGRGPGAGPDGGVNGMGNGGNGGAKGIGASRVAGGNAAGSAYRGMPR